jgi:hypothetical protein
MTICRLLLCVTVLATLVSTASADSTTYNFSASTTFTNLPITGIFTIVNGAMTTFSFDFSSGAGKGTDVYGYPLQPFDSSGSYIMNNSNSFIYTQACCSTADKGTYFYIFTDNFSTGDANSTVSELALQFINFPTTLLAGGDSSLSQEYYDALGQPYQQTGQDYLAHGSVVPEVVATPEIPSGVLCGSGSVLLFITSAWADRRRFRYRTQN